MMYAIVNIINSIILTCLIDTDGRNSGEQSLGRNTDSSVAANKDDVNTRDNNVGNNVNSREGTESKRCKLDLQVFHQQQFRLSYL